MKWWCGGSGRRNSPFLTRVPQSFLSSSSFSIPAVVISVCFQLPREKGKVAVLVVVKGGAPAPRCFCRQVKQRCCLGFQPVFQPVDARTPVHWLMAHCFRGQGRQAPIRQHHGWRSLGWRVQLTHCRPRLRAEFGFKPILKRFSFRLTLHDREDGRSRTGH